MYTYAIVDIFNRLNNSTLIFCGTLNYTLNKFLKNCKYNQSANFFLKLETIRKIYFYNNLMHVLIYIYIKFMYSFKTENEKIIEISYLNINMGKI